MSEAVRKSTGVGAGCMGCLWLVAAAVILAVAFGFVSGDDEPDGFDVQVACEDLVERQLRNPTTAEFRNQEQSLSSASGWVVAENALGGKVTMTYRCTSDGETVRLVSLDER